MAGQCYSLALNIQIAPQRNEGLRKECGMQEVKFSFVEDWASGSISTGKQAVGRRKKAYLQALCLSHTMGSVLSLRQL